MAAVAILCSLGADLAAVASFCSFLAQFWAGLAGCVGKTFASESTGPLTAAMARAGRACMLFSLLSAAGARATPPEPLFSTTLSLHMNNMGKREEHHGKMYMNSMGKSEEHHRKILRHCLPLLGHSMVNIIERYGQTLRRMILLHFWTSNFSISLWERLTTHHFHGLRIFGLVHDSQQPM